MADEFHLRTNENFDGYCTSNPPGDQNKFVKMDNFVMTYGIDGFKKPYINVAQSISHKNKDLIYYTNYLKISDWKVDDNTENVLRMYLGVIQRKYDKILKQLKDRKLQAKLDNIKEDF